MARSQQGRLLTQTHREGQLRLRARTLRELLSLLPAWDVQDPDTFPAFAQAVLNLTQLRRTDAAKMAATYYQLFRLAEGAKGKPALIVADSLDPALAMTSIAVTSKVTAARAMRNGKDASAAKKLAIVTLTGAVTRHVINGSRETLTQSAIADPSAKGWQRVTSGNSCDYCAGLAGSVYQSDAGFTSHDSCMCSAEPVYQ